MALARMRTVKQCLEHFRKEDPECCISEYYLRCLVKQNKVPVFHTGRKQLINLDKLIDYLNSGPQEEVPVQGRNGYGRIRQVGD